MKHATIHRLVTPDHLCPWGIKAIDLLKRHHFDIDDQHITSSEDNKTYKQEHGVDETPDIHIGGKHIGGYEALREHLGLAPEESEGPTYQPVIAIFATGFFMALATVWVNTGGLSPLPIVENFIAIGMILLGIQKLQNLSTFTTGFVQYDLLAQKYVPYGYLYPFVETGAGLLMLGGLLTWLAAPAALIVSTIGAISVFKAVYLEKRDLECACTGGGDGVPLGFISLTENLMMMAMATWMMIKELF